MQGGKQHQQKSSVNLPKRLQQSHDVLSFAHTLYKYKWLLPAIAHQCCYVPGVQEGSSYVRQAALPQPPPLLRRCSSERRRQTKHLRIHLLAHHSLQQAPVRYSRRPKLLLKLEAFCRLCCAIALQTTRGRGKFNNTQEYSYSQSAGDCRLSSSGRKNPAKPKFAALLAQLYILDTNSPWRKGS